jgi:DNA-binding MarR family transcriptional regulator
MLAFAALVWAAFESVIDIIEYRWITGLDLGYGSACTEGRRGVVRSTGSHRGHHPAAPCAAHEHPYRLPFGILPMAQVELLLAVQDHPPVRIGQLADLLRLAPNTVSGLVQALVESGLVERSPDPFDRRVAVVTLTPAGRAKLAGWEQAHQRRIGDALDQLAIDDQVVVRAAIPALARLVEHLATVPR